jgi:hypothetical protein
MMRTINIFLALLLIVATTSSFSAGKKPSKLIIGTWGVESVDMSEMLNGVPEEEKAMYEAFLPMMDEAFKTMLLTFRADGTMSTKANMMGTESSDEGTWVLSKDGKTLTTTSNGKTDNIVIEKLTKSVMLLVLDADGMKVKLLMKKN